MHCAVAAPGSGALGIDLVTDPALDREGIAELAYYCYEARGCLNDSHEEDRFTVEAILCNRLATGATD